MINFESITFQNFLSYGKVPTTYEFSTGITRIKGENGSGKSSAVVDPLFYALFGKPYRKKQKLDQLINTINRKRMAVVLKFDKDGVAYRIERGLKPSHFRIYEDDELVPVPSHNRSYQEILEEDILHFNEGIFNQILIKSMAKNMSFLTLSKGDKRRIAEGILNIEIFSVMNKLARGKMDDCDSRIDIIIGEIQHTKNLIQQEATNLQNLKAIKLRVDDEAKNRKRATKRKIKALEEKMATYEEALAKLDKYKIQRANVMLEVEQLNLKLRKLKGAKKPLDTEIMIAQKKIEMFQETCPSCPKIAEMKDNYSLKGRLKKLAEINVKIGDTNAAITETKNRILKLDTIITNEKFVKSSIEETAKNMAELHEDLKSSNIDEIILDETTLRLHRERRSNLEVEYNTLNAQRRHMNIMRSLLSDDGIKTFIIKRYLPHINKLLNTYLQKFNTDILFYFDAEFNEVIGTRFKENFNYFSFSEGQKRRIDLAIMFTFLEFCKIKNRKSETNLLVLDEITAGVDGPGENMLYDVLREQVTKENKEVITVSHSGNIDVDKIDNVYDVTMQKGFSCLTKVES